ncbi:MAG TPA: M20/M25/M40 family metallo-hydrolase [Candidatus Binataceae bacterium]|nr:M20/M25/M40 family metallo-hydrolase [Candidatus Binataceae bacterium]
MRISSQPVKWFCAAIGAAMLAAAPAAFAQSAEKPHLTRDSVATKAPAPKPIEYDKLTQEATAFLSKYIQINTTNPPGDELPAAKLLKEKFLSDGVPATTWEPAPGRGIVAARLHGIGKHHKAIILLCHMDVVPANPKEWEVPPFSGEVKDGVIWGRGAIDDKGSGVVEMMAMLAIKRAGILLDRDVILIATGDEEEGGKTGAGWFVDHQPSVYADAGYVLNEGGGITDAPGGKKIYYVSVTEKTPLWLRLTATGPPGHAAVPPADTAVTKLVRALARLDEYHTPIRIIGPVENYYHTMAEITHGPRQLLDLASALKEPAFVRQFVAVPRQNAAVRDTITPTVLAASSKTNVISENASCEIDCRLLPGTDPKKFLRTIQKVIDDKSIRVDVILNFPPVSSPQRSELMTAIEALARHDGKAQVVPTMISGFTDSHYFRQKNLIAYGFMPISVTSDEAHGVHGINERISVKELGAGIKRMIELLEQFGGR